MRLGLGARLGSIMALLSGAIEAAASPLHAPSDMQSHLTWSGCVDAIPEVDPRVTSTLPGVGDQLKKAQRDLASIDNGPMDYG